VIHGELDWIVMKCLEKDRTRRYETANGLAIDVQHYLANEPILASPPNRLPAGIAASPGVNQRKKRALSELNQTSRLCLGLGRGAGRQGTESPGFLIRIPPWCLPGPPPNGAGRSGVPTREIGPWKKFFE
jgi:hypothetical protein